MITKLLVANRGEIAGRIFRTARAMGMATVAVFSDADAALPYVTDADEAVRLPGLAAADTYLDAGRIVDAARRSGADAVHPGYGFLSENAAFARACLDAGLTWVGPPPGAIEAMGDKVRAKAIMAAAGVPVLPTWTPPEFAGVEFPVLVKAAFGGGGRGMRVVREPGGLTEAVASARAEATAAFGDGTVFLERYVEAPRHIEVQVFADTQGTVVHLFERECSIQRRHQKVIEEAPSPAVDQALRDELCAAAVAAAKAIGYVGAGTVEFIVDGDGRFAFLEVNTRLQVEHPVTELVTGLDLVRMQLEVAAGQPLPCEALEASLAGHAIEARLYAEDVAGGFLPASGTLHRFRVGGDEGIRVDAGYADGCSVSTHYDAMLAKVIAWAPTRTEAAARLAAALRRGQVHGVVTNRDLLVGTLRHPEFLAGRTDTAFFERHDPIALSGPVPPEMRRMHAAAAARELLSAAASTLPTPSGVPPSWRNVGPALQPVIFEDGGDRIEISDPYADEDAVHARVEVHRVGSTSYVDSSAGSSVLVEVPRLPLPDEAVASGSLLAPMPGTVVAVVVSTGDAVAPGQPVVVIEAMKMQHTIRAPHAGTVHDVAVAVGDQVDGGTVLAVIEAG